MLLSHEIYYMSMLMLILSPIQILGTLLDFHKIWIYNLDLIFAQVVVDFSL